MTFFSVRHSPKQFQWSMPVYYAKTPHLFISPPPLYWKLGDACPHKVKRAIVHEGVWKCCTSVPCWNAHVLICLPYPRNKPFSKKSLYISRNQGNIPVALSCKVGGLLKGGSLTILHRIPLTTSSVFYGFCKNKTLLTYINDFGSKDSALQYQL